MGQHVQYPGYSPRRGPGFVVPLHRHGNRCRGYHPIWRQAFRLGRGIAMSGRLAVPSDLRRARLAARQIDMTATPAMKTLSRIERRIRQHCWASYEGHSLNHPLTGDVLVHLRTANGGRRSIRILPSGAMRWAKGPVVFVPELFDAAAE
jgi:hypothetical protein